MKALSVDVKIRYSGLRADDHRLNMHDGSTSLLGFSQALAISTHAFLNQDLIVYSTALRGAELEIKGARQGSLIFDLEQIPIILVHSLQL